MNKATLRLAAYSSVFLTVGAASLCGCFSSEAIDPNVDTSQAYEAAWNGDYATVSMALGNGLGINEPDDRGMTLLHYAVQGNQEQMVIDLIEKHPGVDVNAKDPEGRTPLSYAKEHQNPWISQVLETAGAQES